MDDSHTDLRESCAQFEGRASARRFSACLQPVRSPDKSDSIIVGVVVSIASLLNLPVVTSNFARAGITWYKPVLSWRRTASRYSRAYDLIPSPIWTSLTLVLKVGCILNATQDNARILVVLLIEFKGAAVNNWVVLTDVCRGTRTQHFDVPSSAIRLQS